MSNTQSIEALSTTKVEYMAATHAAKKGINMVIEIVIKYWVGTTSCEIDCGHSAIFLAKNPTYHSKTKHIDIQYHFVRDMIKEKVLLMKVDTSKNIVDSLKKIVSTDKFSSCKETMDIIALDC